MQLLSFRELRLRLEARELQEKASWNRTLLVYNGLTGDNLTYEKLQERKGGGQMTKEKYEDLKDQLL